MKHYILMVNMIKAAGQSVRDSVEGFDNSERTSIREFLKAEVLTRFIFWKFTEHQLQLLEELIDEEIPEQ